MVFHSYLLLPTVAPHQLVPSHPSRSPNRLISLPPLPAILCSDISYESVQLLAARVRAAGANLLLLGGHEGMLASTKPVVAVTAVRTGCGKSQASGEKS